MCAVFGGIYILKSGVQKLVIEDGVYKGVVNFDGQTLNSTFLISNSAYFPNLLSQPSE